MNIRDVVAGTILGMVISTPTVQKKLTKMVHNLQNELKKNFLVNDENTEEEYNE